MAIYTSSGFPSRVTDEIELPNIDELMLYGNLQYMDMDYVYKNGSDFHRYIIDGTPITNKKKYVNVSFNVRYLHPGVSPVINRNKEDLEWHVDGTDSFNKDEVVFHILQNNTTSLTDFNTGAFSVERENESIMNLVRDVFNNEESEYYSLISPQEAEPFKIYTFNNTDIHRAKRTTKPEIRFFYRVIESNNDFDRGNTQAEMSAYVFDKNEDPILNSTVAFEKYEERNRPRSVKFYL